MQFCYHGLELPWFSTLPRPDRSHMVELEGSRKRHRKLELEAARDRDLGRVCDVVEEDDETWLVSHSRGAVFRWSLRSRVYYHPRNAVTVATRKRDFSAPVLVLRSWVAAPGDEEHRDAVLCLG